MMQVAVMSQSSQMMNDAVAAAAENSGANALTVATAAGSRDPPTKVLTLFRARFARAITSIFSPISPYIRSSSFRAHDLENFVFCAAIFDEATSRLC